MYTYIILYSIYKIYFIYDIFNIYLHIIYNTCKENLPSTVALLKIKIYQKRNSTIQVYVHLTKDISTRIHISTNWKINILNVL